MLKLPFSKICAVRPVPLALQNRALREGRRALEVPRKGEEEAWPATGGGGQKGKKD